MSYIIHCWTTNDVLMCHGWTMHNSPNPKSNTLLNMNYGIWGTWSPYFEIPVQFPKIKRFGFWRTLTIYFWNNGIINNFRIHFQRCEIFSLLINTPSCRYFQVIYHLVHWKLSHPFGLISTYKMQFNLSWHTQFGKAFRESVDYLGMVPMCNICNT